MIQKRFCRWAVSSIYTLALLVGHIVGPAFAGPPYFNDDPETTDEGHWEVYTFASGTKVHNSNSGQAGLDLSYGAGPDLQLTAVLPVDYASAAAATAIGAGDIEFAAKLRFLHQSEETYLPDLAVFPRVFVPTAAGQFGARGTSLLVPIWFQKDVGPWTWFGGGGVQFNFGAKQHDFDVVGIALQRKINDSLSVGGEVLHQSRTAEQASAYSAVNLGLTYQMTPHLALLASFGPGLENAPELGRLNFYTALELTW